MKKLSEKRWFWPALTIVWMAVIFLHSLQPGDVSAAESGRVLALLRKIVPGISELFVRKAAHFCEFFVLGYLLWKTHKKCRRPWLPALAGGLLTAMADEGIQRFVPERSGEIKDVLLDFAGVCLAVLINGLINERRVHGGK